MWYFLAVVVCFAAIYIWRHRDRNIDKDSASMPRDEEQLRKIVQQLHVQILEDKGTGFIVAFQGGTFTLTYTPIIDSFEILMPDIEPFAIEDFPCALVAANEIHNKYKLWRCLVEIGSEVKDKPCNVSLSCSFPLSNNAQTIQNLEDVMGIAFYVARDFGDFFDKEKKEHVFSVEKLQDINFRNKLALAHNRWETMPHRPTIEEKEDEVNGGPLTIRRLLAFGRDVDWGKLILLRILAEGRTEKINEEEKILAFDIYDFIFHHYNEEWSEDFALQLTAENNGLLICLRRADGCTDKTLFYNVQIYKTGLKTSYNTESYFSDIRIEIRLSTLDNDLWETKYMIGEAMAKEKKKGFSNLSEMEKAIVTMTTDSLQAHMYWGQRYYIAKCFYQALEHFRYIYRYCRDNWQKLNRQERDSYFDVCYYIGFIYMDMNMMEKAYRFLDVAAQTNHIPYMEEFINCVCNMKDPAALTYINSYTSQVNNFLRDNEPNDTVLAFKEFLERRYVYAQIDRGMYDEARQHLNQMIERGISVDFARKELDYLDKLTQANVDDIKKEENP